MKGVSGSSLQPEGKAAGAVGEGKPWRKHNNKHKKEKTRRTCPSY